MRSAKTTGATPKAIAYDMHEHNQQEIDAMLLVTRTEHVPLVFGRGDQTPGQIIDEMLKEGHVSKIVLDLDKDSW